MSSLKDKMRAAANIIAAHFRRPATEKRKPAASVHPLGTPAPVVSEGVAAGSETHLEEFPPLPLSPFHRNALLPRDVTGLAVPWELPGDEHYPHGPGRRVNALWLEHPVIPCLVRNKTFFLPAMLLQRYDFWQGFFAPEVPLGHIRTIHADPDIFGFLMEILISPSGMNGTEPGINLVYLTGAMALSLSFGMDQEFDKLRATFRRYLAQRVLYRNPYQPDMENMLDHEYFVYRSEELYRAFKMVTQHPRLIAVFPPIDLAVLYWLVIPQDIWPAVTANFDDDFIQLIELVAIRTPEGPEHMFVNVYQQAIKEASYLSAGWMRQRPAPAPCPQANAVPSDNSNDAHNDGEVNLPDYFGQSHHPATPPHVADALVEDGSMPAPSPHRPGLCDGVLASELSERLAALT